MNSQHLDPNTAWKSLNITPLYHSIINAQLRIPGPMQSICTIFIFEILTKTPQTHCFHDRRLTKSTESIGKLFDGDDWQAFSIMSFDMGLHEPQHLCFLCSLENMMGSSCKSRYSYISRISLLSIGVVVGHFRQVWGSACALRLFAAR